MDVETLLKQLDVGQKKLHKELQQLKTTQNKRENHELSTDKSRHSINKSFNVALDRTIGSRDTTLDTSQYGGLDRRMREKSIKTPRRCSGNAMVCPGYDWVAGLMDVTSISYNEDWLRELKEFRQINHQDCYMPHQDILTNSEPNKSCDNHMTRETTPTTQPPTDIHSYYIGERLFPVPINCSCRGEILCPVCEDLFKPRPPTQPPLNVQISVPNNMVGVPYKVKPHRRASFNPSDSMGLSQHCLSGWHNPHSSLYVVPTYQSISLKSSQ